MKKSTSSSKSTKTVAPLARKKLALKKDTIADLSLGRKAGAVKAGAYTYGCSGSLIKK